MKLKPNLNFPSLLFVIVVAVVVVVVASFLRVRHYLHRLSHCCQLISISFKSSIEILRQIPHIPPVAMPLGLDAVLLVKINTQQISDESSLCHDFIFYNLMWLNLKIMIKPGFLVLSYFRHNWDPIDRFPLGSH